MESNYTTETNFELVRKNQLAETSFGLVRKNRAELRFGPVNKNECLRGEE